MATRVCRCLAVLTLLLSLQSQAQAGLLYSNGDPTGDVGWGLNSFTISDSFPITSAATLTQVHLGLLTDASVRIASTPASVSWAIGTSAFDSSLGSGTATLSNTFLFLSADLSKAVYDSTFAINIPVGAGTYYLTLGNGTTSDGNFLEWDQTNGPSTAQHSIVGAIPSESFAIYGDVAVTVDPTSAPEPASLTLLALGALGAGWLSWRRKTAKAA